jgi:CHAT domain-containing protein
VHTKLILIGLVLLLLPQTGQQRKPYGSGMNPAGKHAGSAAEDPPDIAQMRVEIRGLLRNSEYGQAMMLAKQGHERARQAGLAKSALRFRLTIAAIHTLQHQYSSAMEVYLGARLEAERNGDCETLVKILANMSSLYYHQGDPVASAAAAEEGLRLTEHGFPSERARLWVLAGAAKTEGSGGPAAEMRESAIQSFNLAVNLALSTGDKEFAALACRKAGWECLRAARETRGGKRSGTKREEEEWLERAETYLTRAHQLIEGSGSRELAASLVQLGTLRKQQRRYSEALELLNEGERLAQLHAEPVMLHVVFVMRGEATWEMGQTEAAWADFRKAVEWARRTRMSVLPADSMRIGTEVHTAEARAGFVELSHQLYFRTRKRVYLEEAFRAAEDYRAASLVRLLAERRRAEQGLPAQYWEVLTQSTKLELALLQEDSEDLRRQAQRLQAQLAEMEIAGGLGQAIAEEQAAGRLEAAKVGLAGSPGQRAGQPSQSNLQSVERVQRALRPDEAYLAFHLGEGNSYLWALSGGRVEVHRLPAAAVIRSAVTRFREDIERGAEAAQFSGRVLYEMLFGAVSQEFINKRRWLLGLDGTLFSAPLAATVRMRGDGRGVRFLVEDHALMTVPNSGFLMEREEASFDGRFVAVADPIYNRADSRWAAMQERENGSLWRELISKVQAQSQDRNGEVLELSRLPGSAVEAEACARAWSGGGAEGEVLKLTGAAANKDRLREAMEGSAAVVHLATHVLQSRQQWQEGLIALSLGSDGMLELLHPKDLRGRMGVSPANLVVLSGCASGRAQALPGAGLLGLTRAWLGAGTNGVIASQWPTPDDSGELFVSFYRHLREQKQARRGVDPAVALQVAQLDMLRSGSWRSAPRYWAAYFLVGRG